MVVSYYLQQQQEDDIEEEERNETLHQTKLSSISICLVWLHYHSKCFKVEKKLKLSLHKKRSRERMRTLSIYIRDYGNCQGNYIS